MSIRKKEGSMDVVQAARLRIRNVFSNGVPVYMSFSAGKDSLCTDAAERIHHREDISCIITYYSYHSVPFVLAMR